MEREAFVFQVNKDYGFHGDGILLVFQTNESPSLRPDWGECWGGSSSEVGFKLKFTRMVHIMVRHI